ncbi:MAG: endonuclease/exonuclease/phosphatase family protein [Syntrophomonadaceae bacterium]|nr:endonuclease/exonuclease/phosphatase family protein [Syntrophomonadaceae bacterium]
MVRSAVSTSVSLTVPIVLYVPVNHRVKDLVTAMPYYHPIKKIRDQEERMRVVDRLLLLRRQLDAQIPRKTESDTLLLATWNIREFGDNRRLESYYYLAEIINRFDLIAIQEVSADLKGLERVMALMNPQWDYIVTDSTDGSAGGGERMAFIYDRSKVAFKNMAGEIVLPREKLIEDGLQFARSPFCVAFQAKWFKFKLVTVHIYYGASSGIDPRRLAEIDTIAAFLARRAKQENESYILLGDFNIVKTSDATFHALEKHGFYIPDSIKQHPSDLGQTRHYDQIAFNIKLSPSMTVFAEGEQRADAFNFAQSVYTLQDLNVYRPYFPEKTIQGKSEPDIEKYYRTSWRTFQMSDHLPLWVELKIDFSDQYLEALKSR